MLTVYCLLTKKLSAHQFALLRQNCFEVAEWGQTPTLANVGYHGHMEWEDG